MTRNRYTWPVEIALRGPFLTQSTSAGKSGLDAVLAVDPQSNKYQLPGTLIRGRLRHALGELTDCEVIASSDVDAWFGEGSDDARNGPGRYDPRRRRIHISDFIGPPQVEKQPRTRIRISPVTGAVWLGMMQLIESPFSAGEAVPFKGEVSAVCDEDEANAFRQLMDIGLRWNAAFGADTGIGFGQVQTVTIDEPTVDHLAAATPTESNATEIWLAVEPQEPFVVAKRRVTGNTFDSSEVIPGAVLKGMVADAIRQWTGHTDLDVTHVGGAFADLGTALGAITFSHAFPSKIGERPVEPPRSLVWAGDNWCDALAVEKSFLVKVKVQGEDEIKARAPAFATDWKDNFLKMVRAEFGWPTLKHDLRVRTEIDRKTRKAADQQLFAYELIVPDKECRWLAKVDLSAVPEDRRAAVVAQIEHLCSNEFRNLGKTKARVRISLLKERPERASKSKAQVDGLVAVTLQTPALIGNPTTIDMTEPESTLKNFYSDYWKDVSGGSLELVRFFASQSLAGGYLAYRFQPNKPYRPFFLTDTGSVFLLKVKDQGVADTCRDEWNQRGLPSGKWVQDNIGDDWKNNPFRREEGYGEVAIDLDCHVKKSPKEVFGSIEEIGDE